MVEKESKPITYVLAASLSNIPSGFADKYMAYKWPGADSSEVCTLSDVLINQKPTLSGETPEDLVKAIINTNPPKGTLGKPWIKFLGLSQGMFTSDPCGYVDLYSLRPLDSKEFEQFYAAWQEILERYVRLGRTSE
ncbi:MAG: hypothetical protein NTY99_00160 [DPANN group archaeon]|nr:hypothetical protein [DPANN group archaeon]